MASAGQAHAHSSQPMHFSSPSDQRLSWWRPWKRGAVGFVSSGYWTVSTFRNICRKVTPKPLTGFRKSSTGDLLGGGAGGSTGGGSGLGRARGTCGAGRRRRLRAVGDDDPVVVRKIQRRDGEPER